MICLDLGFAGIDVDHHHGAIADRRDTDTHATADALLLAVVFDLVFEAFDQQIAADVGGDAVGAGTGTGATQRGVATGGDRQRARGIGTGALIRSAIRLIFK